MDVRPGIMLALLAIGLALFPATSAVADETQPKPVDLRAAERKGFSQFGEDGVVEKIFEIIEPGPKFAVEFGAYDGITNSNMRNLVVNHGWNSFQIEGNKGRAKNLARNYLAYPGTTTMQAWVWPGNIEILFERGGVPKDLDFLVIDIDSNDYYVWRAIHDFRPKVVMIETNLVFPPPELMVIDYHPMNYWDQTYYYRRKHAVAREPGKEEGLRAAVPDVLGTKRLLRREGVLPALRHLGQLAPSDLSPATGGGIQTTERELGTQRRAVAEGERGSHVGEARHREEVSRRHVEPRWSTDGKSTS